MLDVRRLEILCAVARTGSLAGAARELSYSTPAVWQHMKRLEGEVGHPLLTPHARGVRLTAAGRILTGHGERLLRRMRLAEEELAALNRLEAGELRVAAFATAGAGLLPDALARFRADHPAVHLALSESDPADALQRLRHGEIDLAVVFTYRAGPDPPDTFRSVHVLDDPLYVVAPAAHPLAEDEGITLQQLRAAGWLRGSYTLADGDGDEDEATVVARGALAYSGSDFNTVQRLVAAGAGLALVPRLALGPITADIAVRPLVGETRSRRVFAVTRRTPPSAATQRFTDLLVETARALQASWNSPTEP
jgi:molybdate transport repressor ModE-like protein